MKVKRFSAIDVSIATGRPYSTVTNYASKKHFPSRDGFTAEQVIDFVQSTAPMRRPCKTPNADDIQTLELILSLWGLPTGSGEIPEVKT